MGGEIFLICALKSKKGSVFDVAAIIVGVFIFIITLFIFVVFLSRLGQNEQIQSDANALDMFNRGDMVFTRTGDNLVLMAFVGLCLVAFISALLSKSHLAFVFVSIIVTMIMITLSVGFDYAYERFASQEIINEAVQYYPKTHFLMTHLPMISVAVAMIIGILIVIQWRGRG